ncbi:hypothetical protein [Anaerococcus hydrogenalis]|uniref:Uncharacterized protein n=1 Tax=Anaerococcus hydrogenalis TaxID=33029 RepID=A0A2N6UIM9_9FIRM|nr:hypothetical protein [Anaerococcus hydrogenalis]MDK7694885.1 hypothetical protein [Anaerococcus hydrogenalis]MDK7696561.1 hypothetical protein [Anaerococcus hydrogenalis]MDK7707912.1 hypothetical protein [Anaerococcus hydrogenalis]PMC81518.1 hypothetical protein CJ192_05680 [Anaerococcus hydrogenalis]
MIKKLIKIFKPNLFRVFILLILFLTMGAYFLKTNMSGGLLLVGDLIFIFVTLLFSDHFDLYKSKKYKNQFLLAVFFTIIIIMILSMVLVYLDMDVNDFKGFKSISFNLYMLTGAYILSLFYKEIRYFLDTKAKK